MGAIESVLAIYNEAPDSRGEGREEFALFLGGRMGLPSALTNSDRSYGEQLDSGNKVIELFPSIVGHAGVDSLLEVQG